MAVDATVGEDGTADAVPSEAQLFLADHPVDLGQRRACVLEVPLGAQRIGLIEKLVHLLGVSLVQGIGVDLVLHGLGGPTHEARQCGADRDTSQHSHLSL